MGETVGGLQARCTDFCPSQEVRLRTKERLLHRLETGRHGIPVKEYARPAAGQRQPSSAEIRTPETLLKTTQYLVSEVAFNQEMADNLVFDFVFDRLRAVRQDMVLQSLEDERAIEILSLIVRFHLMSDCRLGSLPLERFDPHINTSHQLDCIKDILLLQMGVGVDLADQEEMAALYLLTNLTATEARLWAVDLPADLRSRPLFTTVLQLAALAAENNYIRFNCLLNNGGLGLPYRLAARRTVASLTARCLRAMSTAYSSPACRYPLAHLSRLLGLKSTDLRQLCTISSIRIVEGSFIQFSKSTALCDKLEALAATSLLQAAADMSVDEWRTFVLHGSG